MGALCRPVPQGLQSQMRNGQGRVVGKRAETCSTVTSAWSKLLNLCAEVMPLRGCVGRLQPHPLHRVGSPDQAKYQGALLSIFGHSPDASASAKGPRASGTAPSHRRPHAPLRCASLRRAEVKSVFYSRGETLRPAVRHCIVRHSGNVHSEFQGWRCFSGAVITLT